MDQYGKAFVGVIYVVPGSQLVDVASTPANRMSVIKATAPNVIQAGVTFVTFLLNKHL